MGNFAVTSIGNSFAPPSGEQKKKLSGTDAAVHNQKKRDTLARWRSMGNSTLR